MWQTIKREELYEEVWSTPLTQPCAKYGLSDNGLRKVCKRLNVPMPLRGHCDAGRQGRRWEAAADERRGGVRLTPCAGTERGDSRTASDASGLRVADGL